MVTMKRPPYLALVAAFGFMRFLAGVVMSLFAFLRMCPEIGKRDAMLNNTKVQIKVLLGPKSNEGCGATSSYSLEERK